MSERELKSAVITGPTGAIGTALCEKMLAEGLTVYAVCRPGSKRVSALPQHERLHRVDCDASDLARLPSMVKQADAFFHFAWAHTIGPGRNDMPSQIDNIRYTIDAVRAALELGCKVFIGAGSQAEYGRVEGMLEPDTPVHPENGYGMAKLCAGEMSRVECTRLGLDHVWARVLSIYGPHDGEATMISTAIRTLLEGERPSFTAGEQQWDYLYSGDAADAFWCMARSGKNGAIYPVGSGQARPLKDYIIALRDAIDPNLPLGLGDVPYGPQQVMYLQADIEPLQRDTGFVPRTAFDEGIRKTIDFVRSNR
jgi:UDP-glucose 4-epimerase